MSDFEHSTITYTLVSIPVEDNSDMGSPGVDGPSSLDYVPGPKEPEQAPPSPVYLPYVPEPVYPEYIPLEDDVFPAEEDPKEDNEEDPEEDPADYPTDRRDDDDDDDDDDDEEDEKEEEHLAPADYTVVTLPAVDHVLSEEETEPFETDECATTPPSPLIPYSSLIPQIPSSPLPIPSPPPTSLTHIEVSESCLLLWKRLCFATPTPNHEVGESSVASAARQDGPTVAREDPYSVARGDLYGFVDRVDVALGRSMSRELNYNITDTWDDLVGAIKEIAPTTLEGVNQRVTNLSTTVEQETTIMYGMMEDAQDNRSLLRARVKLLYRDRHVYRRLAVMIEREARMAHEAWGLSMDASDYAPDHRRQGVIKELLAAEHQRQVQLTKVLKLLKGLQTEMADLLSIMGYSQLADYIDVLFCLATQYRSFVQAMIDEGVTAALVVHDATRNGDDSHTSRMGARRPVQVACECTYPNFLKCQPLNFKGTEGVVKFAMCTLTLKKMMTDKYCPRDEIKKLEFEMWNLKVKGIDVVTYRQRFQELALMCDWMFLKEIDKVKKYVGGLPDMIHGSVMATKPKTMQDAIEFATKLMDKKINTWAERQADNKRKSDDTARNNQN
ncbi:hypothetical protein Tco_0662564 [Tanacetum coccineum]